MRSGGSRAGGNGGGGAGGKTAAGTAGTVNTGGGGGSGGDAPTVSVTVDVINNSIIIYSAIKDRVDEIKSFIQSEGITLVLCDGDSKVNEFKQLSPLLKIGDVIMAHDYIFNRQIFESDFFEKIWNWCEVTDEDINQTCSEQNLKDFMMEDFEKIVWVCKRKTDS